MDRDPSLPAQGYRLRVASAGATMEYADGAGRRYGLQTLAQLRAQFPSRLPELDIVDDPDIPTRGYMLDISRNRVPTRRTLERLVTILSLARINHLQLYTEHTYAYRDHRVVWSAASPLTADDLRWLDAHCAASGIELSANQNCFGHMERWLLHERYAGRAECIGGFDVMPGVRMPPSTFAPTIDNAAFAHTLFDELLPNFASRRVNIGCDETFELGKGASRDACEARGTGVVFAEHVAKIAEPLLQQGYEVLFWADMLRSHPEGNSLLSAPGLTPVAWTYEAPRLASEPLRVPKAVKAILDSLGIDLAAHNGFGPLVAALPEREGPLWLAPGTSTWNSLIGRLDNAIANLDDALEVARRIGADGLLITDWGDNGHLQPPIVSMPAIVYGGANAWCGSANHDLDLAAALDRFVFADPTGRLGGALDTLGRLWARTGQRPFNASPLQAALCPHQPLFASGTVERGAVAEILDALDGSARTIDAARPACEDGPLAVRELLAATDLARHGAWRMARAAGAGAPDERFLRGHLGAAIEEFRACWLARSQPGGLDESAAHLERTLASYPPSLPS